MVVSVGVKMVLLQTSDEHTISVHDTCLSKQIVLQHTAFLCEMWLMLLPNGLPLSCAAWIDQNHVRVLPTFKKATISRPHSGVSYSGLFGGGR
jgi:hypothetical protein